MFVLDACIYIKLFSEEQYSQESYEFFEYCLTNSISLYVPELFQYEIIHTASKKEINVKNVLDIFLQHTSSILNVFSPDGENWNKAIDMAQNGNKNSGYPAIYDSIYHVYALQKGMIFITSDMRHISKTQQFGNILHIKDWRQGLT